MKKIIWIVVVILIILTIFFGLDNEDNSSADLSKEPIKIGATLALSGPLSFLGEVEQGGLLLAIEDINNNGGINRRALEAIIEDNQGQPDIAVSSVQKLISTDNVDVVLSAFTHITQAIKGVVGQSDKPMLYISSIPDIAEENKLFFRDYFDGKDAGYTLGKKVAGRNFSNITYLGEQNDACESYYSGLTEALSESEQKFSLEERYAPNPTDLRTQLTKFKSAGSDALITCTWRDSEILMPQLKQLGMMNLSTFQLHAPFLPNANTEEMKSLYEENGSISTWHGYAGGSKNSEQIEFEKRFEEKFGFKPSSDSAFVYDDIMILANTIEQCLDKNGEIENECFSKTLLKTNYNGIAGNLSFNNDGVSQREHILMEVIGGEWVEIK